MFIKKKCNHYNEGKYTSCYIIRVISSNSNINIGGFNIFNECHEGKCTSYFVSVIVRKLT